MDLLSLFRKDKEFERIPGKPRIYKYAPSEVSTVSSCIKPMERGTDYVQQYIDEENRQALETAKLSSHNDPKAMELVSEGTSAVCTIPDIDTKEATKVYETFNFDHRPKDLPILQSKEEIVSTIDTHSVTVIEGSTGCGKSTQVPQFILDSCYSQRKHCNIIVTQPRRIAAISIAKRVSQERNWPFGSLIGVQVGMYKHLSKDTRLTYCTTGVLLRKLITSKNMLEFTHVVLDEVHERDQEMDFLLLVIRKLLRTNSRQVKVILMSATFNSLKFSNYFSTATETGFVRAPIVSIAKKRNYKVHKHYLDRLETLGAIPEVSMAEPRVTEAMMKFCTKLVRIFDDIDKDSEYDAEDLEKFQGEKPRHTTLIFLPGIWEIEEMHNYMSSSADTCGWDIVILHSSITYEEQSKIFNQPPKGYRRIILSTNIAESSITIDDVKYVIDFCLTKQLITDPGTNFQCLELSWASKANCEQRAGRAGRLMDGRTYRLVPEAFYQKLPAEGDPEIVRAPLEGVVLQTKLLDMGEPKAVLALAIDPPDLSNLERTILLLKESGGLVDPPGIFRKFDGDMTDLGRIMAGLPIEIHLAKLIALGHVFNVLRDAIIMAASMAVKSMFNNPFKNQMDAFLAKLHWADGSTSDCLAFLNVYRVWMRDIATTRIKRKSNNERLWANRNYLQVKVIHEVDYLVRELTNRLEHLGIKETVGAKKIVMDDVDKSLVLKIVIAGAFYPNYFVRSMPHDDHDETRQLAGLDPTRTVYLQGWKFDHPGKLYCKRIQEVFKDAVPDSDQALVEFDSSQKVYVMFNDDKNYGTVKDQAEIPGKVSLSVYKALKWGKIRKEVRIPVLDLKTAKQRAEKLKLSSMSFNNYFNSDTYEVLRSLIPPTLPALPSMDISTIPIKVAYFQNPGKFWCQINDPDTEAQLQRIETFLNDKKNITLVPLEGPLKIGILAAAEYTDGKIYRVIVESFYKVKNDEVANILYIDYGFRGQIRKPDLKTIKADHEIAKMRALAFECTLSKVAPSRKRDAKGLWTKEACVLFKKYTNKSYKLFGTVFSVVDSIVALNVICTDINKPKDSLNLNDTLLKEGLAETSQENYLSKYNNELRQRIIEYQPQHREFLEFLQYNKNFLVTAYPDPPKESECHSQMILKGPMSPLEIHLTSLAIVASAKKVSIDNQSVNSILLETDPDNPQERLLVSGVVSQNQSGSHLTLRNTTLMPNIPGLTALLSLIFAPKIELRRNSRGTAYVGALCGLGGSPKNIPLLPEHDMEVYFNTEITLEDLQNINRLRHWMNLGICVQSNEVDDLHEQAIRCQHKVSEFLRKLINRQITYKKVEQLVNFNKWGYYDESLFLTPGRTIIKQDSIYPLHSALQLEALDEELQEMMAHIQDLRKLSISDQKLQENIDVHCNLCDEDILGRQDLRAHLFSKMHRERESAIGEKCCNI